MSKNRPYRNSAKVPLLFHEASIILKKLNHGGSYNSLIFNNRCRDPQGLAALVSKASQYRSLIDRVILATRLPEIIEVDIWLVRILIAQLCFGGKRRLGGASQAIKAVLKYRNEIREAVVKEDKFGVRALNQVRAVKPRYVRVNTLKITTEEFIKILKDEGYGELICPETYDKFLKLVEDTLINKKSDEIFLRDFHIKDMLVFPKDTFLQNHPAYREGKIVLQDKASCLQSCCVKPPPGSVVLDMCAAPGMKTSLYAAMIQNKGKVYAIERSENRFKDMQNILKGLGATCVTTINNDAGIVGPETCENVEYIIVDPSCSGSGMSGRAKLEDLETQFLPKDQTTIVTQSAANQRIQKLQNLQTYLLKHALSNFPRARCIVYSTCSTYQLENEAVVENCANCARLNGFEVVDLRTRLKGWRNFGNPGYECGERTVYTKQSDLMNGGFFAVFERRVVQEEEVVLVKKEEVEEKERRKEGEEDLVISLAVKLLDPLPGTFLLNLSNVFSIQATTSLIQSHMQDVGKIYIVIDDQNGKKLANNLEKCFGKCAEVKRLSALESSGANCPGVDSVLVFPESSGSKSANRPLSSNDLHQQFVIKQFSLLRHALTAFPQVKHIVFATTSIHPAENEDIIDALLVVAKFHGFNLVDAVARVGDWQNSRQSKYHWGEKCLMQQEGSGKGLFVAVFERNEDKEGLRQGGQLEGRVEGEAGQESQEFKDSAGVSRRSASGAEKGLLKGNVGKKSGQWSKDFEESAGVSGSVFGADSTVVPNVADVPSSAPSAIVPSMAHTPGYAFSRSAFGAISAVLPNTADVPSSADSVLVSNMVDFPNSSFGADSAVVPKTAYVSKSTHAAGSDLSATSADVQKLSEDSSLIAKSVEDPRSKFASNPEHMANSAGVSSSTTNLPLIAAEIFKFISSTGSTAAVLSQEPANQKKSPSGTESTGAAKSVAGEYSDQVSESIDVVTGFPAGESEVLNVSKSSNIPRSASKAMNKSKFSRTNVSEVGKVARKAEMTRRVRARGKKKPISNPTAFNLENCCQQDLVSTKGEFFVIDKEGNICNEDGTKRNCDDLGTEKMRSRRKKEKNKWTRMGGKGRKLMQKERKKAKMAEKLDPKTSFSNSPPSNVGHFQPEILPTGSDFFVIDREGKKDAYGDLEDDIKRNSDDFGNGHNECRKMAGNLKRKIDEFGNKKKRKRKPKKSKNSQKSGNEKGYLSETRYRKKSA